MLLGSIHVWALDQKDGAYQIATGEDLLAFSNVVNSGELSANAVLTADIDMSGLSDKFIPIGSEACMYSGTFDGQGHKISNLTISLSQDRVGLFGVIQSPAAIRNFVIESNCSFETTGNYCAIIGSAMGAQGNVYMENLGMEANVTLSGKNGGGIIGNNQGSVAYFQMKNCYMTGNVSAGSNSGLLTGYAGPSASFSGCWGTGQVVKGVSGDATYFIRGLESGTITNCYSMYGSQVPKITDEQVASGELCFNLNGDQSEVNWYQTLGQDAHPVLDATHGRVYTTAERRCDGQIIGDGEYVNDASKASAVPAHQYEDGFCTVCGQKDTNFMETDADGFYNIKNASQLMWFASAVNNGDISLKARLTADIDMAGVEAVPIGKGVGFDGTFDGQGHVISNFTIQSTQDYTGLFSLVKGGAVIKGFTMKNAKIEGTAFVGIIGGSTGSGTIVIDRVGFEGEAIGTAQNVSGIIGVNMNSTAVFKISNCYVTGTIRGGRESAAITGWAGSMQSTITNCWSTAEVSGNDDGKPFFRYDGAQVANCYNQYGLQVTQLTDEMLSSGELTYNLNRGLGDPAWYQTLGTDVHPVLTPTSKPVYVIASDGYLCDGTPKGNLTYTNDAQNPNIPAHEYSGYVCKNCSQINTDFVTPQDGVYPLGNGIELAWFAEMVNSGNNTLNARLTDDIDMAEYSSRFMPIGSSTSMYCGTFDGQYHRISNLKIFLERDRVGLFGVIQSPAVIKNLILDASCQIESNANYAGIIGSAMGTKGDIYMENLGMEGNVKLDGKNGGGIIGNNQDDAAIFHMKNCYMTGNVTAGTNSGLLTAWAGANAIIESCWGSGEVLSGLGSQGEYFVRGLSGGSMTNCFSKYGTQGSAPNFDDEALRSGELCFKLNGESFINPAWFQTLDEDLAPVWDSTHGTVYKAGDVFGDVHDDASFAAFKNAFLASEKEYCENVIAEQKLIDQYAESIETTESSPTMADFAKAYDDIKSMRKFIESSANAYAALQAKADEVLAYLEEHDDFEGEKRDQLEYYLTESEEPSELYPNGTLRYIMETHTMTEAEVNAEATMISQMLEAAILDGHTIHSDITKFLTNADFHDGYNGWSGVPGTGNNAPAAECKNATCDFYQTLTDLENGVYEVQVNGFFRPGNSISAAGNSISTNYGAFLYANGMQNYLMAAIEDMISVSDAVDGENCYITNTAGSTFVDYEIYNTEGDVIGYVPGGQTGFKFAANAGRYLNRVLVNVTDGQLTVGFRMPGTGIANDCMNIANVKLFYHGTMEDAKDEVDAALACMAARAQTLYEYEASYGADYAEYPNYSAELRAALKKVLDAVPATSTTAEKYELMGTLSNLFQQIYDNKKEYVKIMNSAESLAELASTITAVLSEAEVKELYSIVDEIIATYVAGEANLELASYNYLTTRLPFLPSQVNGVYQIDNATALTIFSVLVNGGQSDISAVLTSDIDMSEYSNVFQPIGTVTYPYSGTFDGQYHHISNLVLAPGTERVGLFGTIQTPATIKNLVADASCSFEAVGNYCGLIAISGGVSGPVYLENLGMEGSVRLSGKNGAGVLGNNLDNISVLNVKNCYMTGTVEAGFNSALLIGYAGNDGSYENCWGSGEVVAGVGGQGDYLIRSILSGTVSNCYSKFGSQMISITDEQVASGELCYLLNGDQSAISWYQNIGEDAHPVFDPSHSTVVKNEDGSYSSITGIEKTGDGRPTTENAVIYDLTGRRVEKTSKGLYIINGKKVLVK